MVAYSFRSRFVDPILSGRKQQTVRAIGKRRHAAAGDLLQLYTGMRTKACRLIGTAPCIEAVPITLRFRLGMPRVTLQRERGPVPLDAELFAQQDGFDDWLRLVAFWEVEHAAEFLAGRFDGICIFWRGINHGR